MLFFSSTAVFALTFYVTLAVSSSLPLRKRRANVSLLSPHLSCLFAPLPLQDIKPNNFFITAAGVVKLGDFGLAASYGSPSRPMTPTVMTIWYRAPELLLGARAYGPAVDVWAMGCVLAELERRDPLLPAQTEIGQLDLIFSLCGTPTAEDWPGHADLPLGSMAFKPKPRVNFRTVMPAASDDATALFDAIMQNNPAKRPSCTRALQHAFFSSAPGPTPPARLPLPKKEAASAAASIAAAEAAAKATGQAPREEGSSMSRRRGLQAAEAEGQPPEKKALRF